VRNVLEVSREGVALGEADSDDGPVAPLTQRLPYPERSPKRIPFFSLELIHEEGHWWARCDGITVGDVPAAAPDRGEFRISVPSPVRGVRFGEIQLAPLVDPNAS
jgi:hypothetical protein